MTERVENEQGCTHAKFQELVQVLRENQAVRGVEPTSGDFTVQKGTGPLSLNRESGALKCFPVVGKSNMHPDAGAHLSQFFMVYKLL